MEYICKILSYDLGLLYKQLLQCNACEPTECGKQKQHKPYVVTKLSYTIRNKYPKRLVTYDAEAAGEPRLIRMSGLSESQLELMSPACTKQEEEEEEDCKSDDKCCKTEPEDRQAAGQQYEQLEQRSRQLHQRYVQCQQAELKPLLGADWKQLKPAEKMRFFWQALTNCELRATPFENYQEAYLQHRQRSDKCQQSKLLDNWRCFSPKQRLPFNMQALLYHVSSGAVDATDQCAIRALLNRWR
ncbi:uncharacterized protein LOC108602512 [Drosophila busckii]|uniref:uncharacterized protein LOC108602512 n=1 Tax=Drosophila busckii TaxID=30019 RepID=UPI00083F4F5A|nr:uncharacterized protein LOC108602512 [Drosophila busckii]